MCSQCFWGGTSGALGYAKDNKVLPLAVSEHVLCLWRTLRAVLPAVVILAVGLGLVVLNELLQLLHLSDQGLYGVPVIRTVAQEHVAPRSCGRLTAGVDPEASGEAAAVAAGRCWLALCYLRGALLAADTLRPQPLRRSC